MKEHPKEVDLKFISAYWCNRVTPEYEDRFLWSWEQADEAVDEINDYSRTILVALAKTAPDEYTQAYFAAGPLEDYINLIVREKQANEAAFIEGNPYLKNLLPFVWGDAEKLGPLSKYKSATVQFQEPCPEKNLKVVEVKELMGFWCRTCVSSIVTDYDVYYERVLKKLLNKKTREAATQDLLISAPDERAAEYLEENVFMAQR